MYNTYLLEGFVPSNWRESYVLPFRKPHLPSTLTTSYRPISLTSIASKVFEKIILQRLLRHLQNGNYLSPQVFGFYPARSTTECLTALFHDILIARERKQFALLCSVDLAKAYDTVSHAILFRKLERMHIPTELLNWIRAFLTNRTFRVRWKSHLSPPFPQSLGLPQGMVLSPILFALFIQDMENVIHPQVRMYMYADDVCLLATSHNWKTVCSYLSGSLTGLTRWSTENQMSFTPRKSGILNLSRRRPGHYCGFLLQDQAVPQVAKLKFLGLWIQESLQWKEHLHYVKARVVKRLSILRFIGNPRWGLTSTQLLQIVNLTIRPVLLYAGPVLYSAPTYIQQEFERLHSAALRACIGVPKPTPLVVLRCASGTYELLTHLTITTTKFLIRHLSLGQDSPLARILSNRTAVDFYHWGPCNAPIVTTFNTHERAGLVDVSQVQKSIFYAPTFLHRTYEIILHTLPFQQRDLPQAHVPRLFAEYLHTLPPATHLVGSDAASKHGRNAIGIYSSIGTSISHRIHGMFTIFSAEALAIMEGISDLVHTDTPTCVLFSDSLSVLSALATVNRKSHPIVLLLHQRLDALITSGRSVTLVWVPGHAGITYNEKADKAASHGLNYPTITLHSIPWTDVFLDFKQKILEQVRNKWERSPYNRLFPHLHPLQPWKCPIGLPRRTEILIQRLRTNTASLNDNLFRWRATDSPNCDHCGQLETLRHYLLECPQYQQQRTHLLQSLGIPNPSGIHDLLDLSDNTSTSIPFVPYGSTWATRTGSRVHSLRMYMLSKNHLPLIDCGTSGPRTFALSIMDIDVQH